jgi:hypothetical protein
MAAGRAVQTLPGKGVIGSKGTSKVPVDNPSYDRTPAPSAEYQIILVCSFICKTLDDELAVGAHHHRIIFDKLPDSLNAACRQGIRRRRRIRLNRR